MSSTLSSSKKPFKEQKTFQERRAESERVIRNNPDRVPVIVQKMSNSSNIPDIPKTKYLAQVDITVGQFVYVIRKAVKMPADQALFVFINNELAPAQATMAEIYQKHKEEDGFLYCFYGIESTFGFDAICN